MKEKKFEYLFEVNTYFTIFTFITILSVGLSALLPILTKKFILILVPVMLFFVIGNTKKIFLGAFKKDRKIKEQVLKDFTAYEGEILGYKKLKLVEYLMGINVGDADTSIYALVIKYEDKIITTPPLVYDPQNFFASTKCTVKIDNQDNSLFYVTNFTPGVTEFIELKEYKESQEN